MRKFLSLMMATFFSVGLFATTYTVAGDSEALFGTTWAPSNEANDMTLVEGGTTYQFVKEGVTLGAGVINFKVAEDHAWTKAYPASNYALTIPSSGVYNVTITFDASKGNDGVGAVAEKKGDAVVIPTIAMHGNFTGSWADTKNFTKAADEKSASLSMTLDAKTFEFGMRIGGSGNWTSNGAQFSRANNSAVVTSGSGNLKLVADVAGEYTFTWTYETNTLSIVFPEKGDEPGGEEPGGDDPQPGTTYYLKNNWNGGDDWTWKAMTAAENNTYKLEKVVFGGTGVNYNTAESDEGAQWVEVAAFDGDEVAKFDTVTFVLDLADKKIKATLVGKYDPSIEPGEDVVYLLFGSDPAIGAWEGAGAVALQNGKATVTLQAGDCEFKVVPNDWDWDKAYGYAQVSAECSSNGISEGDNGNVKVKMPEGGGDLTVEIKEGKLCVTGNFVTEGGGGEQEKSYLLIGSDPAIGGAEWEGSKAVALQNGKATVTLQAGDCQFKVVPSDWNWDNALGFAQVDAECSSEGISEGDNGNVKITMAEAGEMTVEVKNGKLCVTGNFVTEGGGDDPQPVTPDGIYLSGSFNEWTAKDEFKFALNEGAEGEEYVLKATLAVNDQVKVVEVANGEWKWYPDDMDNAYIVDAEHAGKVTIYFQKTSKEDWAAFGGYMYIEAESGTGISNTLNDVKAQKFIENGQLFIIVNGATYTVMGQTR